MSDQLVHAVGAPTAGKGETRADPISNPGSTTFSFATEPPTLQLDIDDKTKRIHDAVNYNSRLYDSRNSAYSN